MEKRTFTREESERYTENAVRELQKRGMVYHAVGHGWTCEPLGIPADGWDEIPDEALAPNMRDKIALVNGEKIFSRNAAHYQFMLFECRRAQNDG